MVSNTRLYGAAIGIASGGYSLWSGATMARMDVAGWIMLLLGVVVLVHGVLLLTDNAERIGDASGPLMIGYAVVMLLVQALLVAGVLGGRMMDGGMGGMNGGMGGMDGGMMGGMMADAGMVVLALLMLVSGLIMHRGEPADDGMPRERM